MMKLKPLRLLNDIVTRWDSAYRMLSRALYLRKAIDAFVNDDDEFEDLRLSKKEWNQASVICTILLPFKIASTRLQSTKRPGIDSVFWDYENLFNKIDALKATFAQADYCNEEWVQELHAGVEKMSLKLQKYYTRTNLPSAYSDSCILEPKGKLLLFQQAGFGGEQGGRYAEKYKQECRERYVKHYEPVDLGNSNPRKRQHESDSDDDDEDYRSFLQQNLRELVAEQNEFDRYLASPPPADEKTRTLSYWKSQAPTFPHLSLMARDTFAVPATGAGVERIFSKSGRVASWTRARLNPKTITEIMLYKDHLSRQGRPLNAEDERNKMESKNERRQNPQSISTRRKEEVDCDSEEEEDDDPVLINWEKEWWRKPGAPIVLI